MDSTGAIEITRNEQGELTCGMPQNGQTVLIWNLYHGGWIVSRYSNQNDSYGTTMKKTWFHNNTWSHFSEQNITHWRPRPTHPPMPESIALKKAAKSK